MCPTGKPCGTAEEAMATIQTEMPQRFPAMAQPAQIGAAAQAAYREAP